MKHMHTYKPEEVFTPRNPDVNDSMYIERPELEEALIEAFQGSQHILIHGESGTGKSWLYKRVLKREAIPAMIANLANASRFGSLNRELENLLEREGGIRKTSYSETKKAGLSVGVAGGELEHEGHYRIPSKEPFEACLEKIRSKADSGDPACLVFDNLETIFDNEKLMNELADIVILLDDPRYAQYDVKLIIVGVPGDVHEYFLRTPHRATVANRLKELPEVSRLTAAQSGVLVTKGFVHILKVNADSNMLTEAISHVSWVTDRIPQRLHEYCLELARLAVKGSKRLKPGMLEKADRRWLGSSMSYAYTVVESAMNERETKVGRRNQILYILGQLERNEIRISEVEEKVRKFFPNSTKNKTLNISQMLADLDQNYRLIKRSAKGDAYVFCDPRYRMCIRAMLSVENESISKIELGAC